MSRGILIESVCQRYLTLLGVGNKSFDVSAELMPSSDGYEVFIEVDNSEAFKHLFDLDSLVFDKARELFNCSGITIKSKGDPRKPLRMSMGDVDTEKMRRLRSYPMPDYSQLPQSAIGNNSTGELSQDFLHITETANILNASVWLIGFDGTYRYFHPRQNGSPLQPVGTMIGKKIYEQELPTAIKQQVAFDHALAIESKRIVTNSYVSPKSGQEIVTKTKPCFEHETCVVFSMLRFQDQLTGGLGI